MFVQFRAGIWLGWCVVGGGFTFTSDWSDQNLHFTLTENVSSKYVIHLSFHGNINDVLYIPAAFVTVLELVSTVHVSYLWG